MKLPKKKRKKKKTEGRVSRVEKNGKRNGR